MIHNWPMLGTFSHCKYFILKTSSSFRDAFKEMKEYEEALYAVRINSDAVFPVSAPVVDPGGAPGSYKLGLYDTC